MGVLALVPARSGSNGVPGKNFTPLAGLSPLERAWTCAREATPWVAISTDATNADVIKAWRHGLAPHEVLWIQRPLELAQDDTPMIDVVRHALCEIPGPPDQIIVLLQPTQPLRKLSHIQAAIALLQETQADSVVSVVTTESPAKMVQIQDGRLWPWYVLHYDAEDWRRAGERRQAAQPTYKRDGTVYAFYRKTVEQYSSIYGQDVRPLIIPPEDTCPLDTPADWAEAERRLCARGQV